MDNSSLVDLLTRSGNVFGMAGRLGMAFYEEGQSRAIFFDPTIWDKHAKDFEQFWDALIELRDVMRQPPEGMQKVAVQLSEAARVAREIRGKLTPRQSHQVWNGATLGLALGVKSPGPPQFTEYLEFFPDLNSISVRGSEAIREIVVARRLDDPLAFLDGTEAGQAESTCASLSDENGVAFLEGVGEEIRYAAEAKRKQLERGYSNQTIELMVRGIRWAEARRQADGLSQLPADTINQVRSVLRRQLSVATIEQIDSLFNEQVRSLRDALEQMRGDQASSPRFADLKSAISLLMRPEGAEVSETQGFKTARHDPLLERLQRILEQRLPEQPQISILQSLQDRGCDLLVEWPGRAKFGIQLKSNGDVGEAEFPNKVLAQIQDSRQHGLMALFVVFAADITKPSNLQKVRGMVSRISTMNDPYVVAVPPEQAWNLLFPASAT